METTCLFTGQGPGLFELSSGPAGSWFLLKVGLPPVQGKSAARALPPGKKLGRPVHQPTSWTRTCDPLKALIEAVFE